MRVPGSALAGESRGTLGVLALVLAEDREGLVEAAGFPEGLDRAVEHQAEAGGPPLGPAGELGRGVVSEAPVVLAGPSGDDVGDQAAAGESAGLGGQLGPPSHG